MFSKGIVDIQDLEQILLNDPDLCFSPWETVPQLGGEGCGEHIVELGSQSQTAV